jgi:signal transduction histidine kinase
MGANLDLYARCADGRELPVEISLSPVRTSAGLQIACAIRDISDRKRVLEQLRDARMEADRANRAKSAFLAAASHDLRQPAHALGLLNGVLQRMVKDPNAVDVLKQQATAISGMSRMLNRLLDITKLESGAIKPELSIWSIQSLFAELRLEYTEAARSKGLSLSIDDQVAWVRSDPSLIGQVLRNLLTNAIKYTHSGGVRLQVAAAASIVRIEVHDTGIGMASEELTRIYDEFYQIGVAANTSRDGYGLGLAIVSRIVKLLDLQLDVRSELGRGSVFSLELPAAERGRDLLN